ncbi:MAG: metallophosphoesterase [Candidatus Thiodiazotropha endolucinida]
MKLHILNDLHIEFEDFVPPAMDADVVILAGDIGVGLEGLRWAEARFPDKPVIYVPGNHEFYQHDITLIDELKAEAPDNIHVLNDDQVVVGGVRFLGSILWTDFRLFGEADKSSSTATDDGFLYHPKPGPALHARGCHQVARSQPGLVGNNVG